MIFIINFFCINVNTARFINLKFIFMLRRSAGPIVQYKDISEKINDYKNNIQNQTLKLLVFKQKVSSLKLKKTCKYLSIKQYLWVL